MKNFCFLITLIGIMMSCASEETEKNIAIHNKYSLSIPSFLTEVNNLNEDASLQYQHGLKEFYVIVIDEPKSEYETALDIYNLTDIYSNDVTGYSKLFLDNFDENGKAEISNVVLDNYPSKLFTMEEQIDGLEIYYAAAIIEGKDNYYQIVTWTLANKKSQYEDRMNRIIHSFKEF